MNSRSLLLLIIIHQNAWLNDTFQIRSISYFFAPITSTVIWTQKTFHLCKLDSRFFFVFVKIVVLTNASSHYFTTGVWDF